MQGDCGFRSFFVGGFECSTHRRADGTRLDLIAGTQHDKFAEPDYRRLQERGLLVCRDGLRWHLIGSASHWFDFSSFLPQLQAARTVGMQVIWDLCHYGWPDRLDPFDARFVDEFASFARAVARVVSSETDGVPWFSPMNEISFFAWAGGETGFIAPYGKGQGDELKRQLGRATIAAMEAIWDVAPRARFLHTDPVIHVAPPHRACDEDFVAAESYSGAQYQSWDMLAGHWCPETGGHPRYLDVLGCNYYVHNQWEVGGALLERTDPRYRPLHRLLEDVWQRYRRPMILAETGIEDEHRPGWLRYVCDEVAMALSSGVPMEGICLFPVVNHPGWDDDRHCHNGLWDYCNDYGEREIYQPLASELVRQQERMLVLKCSLKQPQAAAFSLV